MLQLLQPTTDLVMPIPYTSTHNEQPSTHNPPSLLGLYQLRVANGQIQADTAQLNTLKHLQQLLGQFLANMAQEQNNLWPKWLKRKPEPCKSLYLYGGVGRGKSMLMDLFYDACPIVQKRRVHFNTFMVEVHAFIHQCLQQNTPDALPLLARNLRASTRVLCFDEFHVTDIADAMILGRLFSALFELGIIVVMTSNRHPNELYQGGVIKEQFQFFIKVLENSAHIIELQSPQDFRLLQAGSPDKKYHFPLGPNADSFITQHYQHLSQQTIKQAIQIEVCGHSIHLTAGHAGVALCSFDELCVQPLGAADYLEIARLFHTVIIYNIPKLTDAMRNEAKRFVTLIDVLYEHKTQVLCSAEVPITEIYIQGDGRFEFERTVSRLIEMQSGRYGQNES